MKVLHKNRLLKLAAFLNKLDPKQFEISFWHNGQKGCGTVACAGGWACSIPSFRRAGLVMSTKTGSPIYERTGETAFAALGSFFGLGYDKTKLIFSAMSYYYSNNGVTTPSEVAERIRYVVKKESDSEH